MSSKYTTAVWNNSKSSGCNRLVMLALADAEMGGGFCPCLMDLLSMKCNMSHIDCDIALMELLRMGEIEPSDQSGKEGYIIIIPTDSTPKKGLEIIVPNCLRTQNFMTAWDKWVAYRQSNFKKLKKPEVTFNSQLEWLAAFPIPVAIEILNASVRNGWQGLFPPKGTVTFQKPMNSDVGKNDNVVKAKVLSFEDKI